MCPVLEPPKRGIGPMGWVAIGCGVLVLLVALAAVGLGVVGYFYIRPQMQRMGSVTQQAAVVPPKGGGPLREVWARQSVPLQGLACGDINTDGRQEVLACFPGRVCILDSGGTQRGSIPVGSQVQFIELGKRSGGPLLVGFGQWQQSVTACDASGKQLWVYHGSSMGVDWACPVDLGLPAGDAVAIGYNGSGGLHLLNPDGTVRWTATGGLGNVWSVSGARLVRGATRSVICAHAGGTVYVYDAQGQQVQQMSPGVYTHSVYGADVEGDGVDEVLASGGMPNDELHVLDAGGSVRWTYVVGPNGRPGGRLATVGRFTGTGIQVAVGSPDGTVAILSGGGQLLGKQALGSPVAAVRTPSVAGRRDLLVVLTQSGCAAYQWTGRGAAAGGRLPRRR